MGESLLLAGAGEFLITLRSALVQPSCLDCRCLCLPDSTVGQIRARSLVRIQFTNKLADAHAGTELDLARPHVQVAIVALPGVGLESRCLVAPVQPDAVACSISSGQCLLCLGSAAERAHGAGMIPFWPYLILAYQLELALACLDAWEFAPARPRLEREVRPETMARRRMLELPAAR